MTDDAPTYLAPVQELDRLRASVARLEGRDQDRPAPAYLDPLHDELDRLRAALAAADARIDELTAALARRTRTQNATGEANDTLVRRLANVETVADHLDQVYPDAARILRVALDKDKP